MYDHMCRILLVLICLKNVLEVNHINVKGRRISFKIGNMWIYRYTSLFQCLFFGGFSVVLFVSGLWSAN